MMASKRILIVAHDQALRQSRLSLLEWEGYCVEAVETDDDAMLKVRNQQFDLILLGRVSRLCEVGIDQRLREKYPNLLTLMIDTHGFSDYPSKMVDSGPSHVLEALHQMLGEKVNLRPIAPLLSIR